MKPETSEAPLEASGSVVMVYVTIGTEADAKTLARTLLQERLVACVNLLPMQSLYWWEGKVEEGPEVGMLLKTTPDRLPDVMRRVPELHPYDVPCVEVFETAAVHGPYAAWVRAEARA